MKKLNGFTLIELLFTMAIGIIISVLGIPNFSTHVNSTRADTDVRSFYRHFQSARTEATKRSQTTTLCGSNDGVICEKTWSKYILIFVDENNDKEAQQEEIITKHSIDSKNVVIKSKISLGLAYIKIRKDGSTNTLGSVIYCPKDDNEKLMRRVTWNSVGRPYIGRDHNNDGIYESTNGEPLKNLCG